ncbi:MAG: class I SAM-dependent methyltransferase [Erysipelotrichales bacterium]
MNGNIRLEKVASFVRKDATLVDIGCDHGFLTIDLVKQYLIKYAYASDVNQGPLDNVKANVLKEGLQDKIECVLSNGLEKFENIHFSDIVIAGMGGTLIIDILSDNIELLKDKRLILQPNINAKGLRNWLIENDFKIINDDLVKDNDIIYQIIVVEGNGNEEYSSLEYEFGKYNLINNNNLLKEYMNLKVSKNNEILSKMPEDNEKYEYFKKINEEMEEYLNEIE